MTAMHTMVMTTRNPHLLPCARISSLLSSSALLPFLFLSKSGFCWHVFCRGLTLRGLYVVILAQYFGFELENYHMLLFFRSFVVKFQNTLII